ncbi:very long chain fatty acid elongase AAEL008004-like [Ornithodoros turicata]|uniref:very long chain fatty acid elongase AAEL008004-like n=1 Tax=Ornithodoros turicata TaxID=34597 RepID=UPI0031391B0B
MSHLVGPVWSGQRPLLLRDPRTTDWKLSGNFAFLSALLVGYVYVVKVAGPRFMKGRQPFHGLKPVILAYNASMVVLNIFFVYQLSRRSYLGGGYSWFCQGLDYSTQQHHLEIIHLIWWFTWLRVADFLDTVFFVLRKKDSHVSFLHVVHHVLVVFNCWFGITYGSDGHILLAVIMNSCVHIIMYSYYFLSLLGPSVQKYLWWKKYLTGLQITQFIAMLLHNMIPIFVPCNYPLSHVLLVAPQTIFFMVMFTRFYTKTYRIARRMSRMLSFGSKES